MKARQRGIWGERHALMFLYDKGFSLVAKNFRSRFGEIDLIVKNNDYIVFVEVKARKNSDFALAREFVDFRKQDKIRSTANLWLSSRQNSLQPRFDVIEVYSQGKDENPQIIHIENAF